ncbi:FAD-dependent oxidoreductase [Alienimonas californiensis]|uniref:Thioredoxin reductase n=1 Tax=Alienimonas californiensis TaxID=2527989 RepID=A0A517PBW2_9PLAN|nr:FAD-dependent oxidoreductase [Alienimonas californiensis]QDT16868.1 Thioredoxin reductase [Alienimonas californiensis]
MAGPTPDEPVEFGSETEKLVIIGSGPAGWAAGIYASRAELRPLCFEGANSAENYANGTLPLGQLALTTEVENFPSWPAGDLSGYLNSALTEKERMMLPDAGPDQEAITGPQLMTLMRRQAKNFGTRVVTDDIAKVDFSQRPFTLTTAGGKTVKAEAVIIATGARANYLGLDSEHAYKNKGVSACAVCDGALPRFRGKGVVVVGGGDSAMEEATYLTKFSNPVYIVHRRDEFRASKIMAERVLANDKITVKWNSVVDEVLGSDEQGVNGVVIRSTQDSDRTETLDVSGYFAAIGHTPNTAFLEGQLELTEKQYVVWTTPFRTHTSVEGVFAAGDVADDYYRQACTAAGTGCMAALDAERWLGAQGIE